MLWIVNDPNIKVYQSSVKGWEWKRKTVEQNCLFGVIAVKQKLVSWLGFFSFLL